MSFSLIEKSNPISTQCVHSKKLQPWDKIGHKHEIYNFVAREKSRWAISRYKSKQKYYGKERKDCLHTHKTHIKLFNLRISNDARFELFKRRAIEFRV